MADDGSNAKDEPLPELARERADGVIDRSKTQDTPLNPSAIVGRRYVRNLRRGNHLGPLSCATAHEGRTYDRKRSDQKGCSITLRGGGRPHMDSGFGPDGKGVGNYRREAVLRFATRCGTAGGSSVAAISSVLVG